MPSCGDVRNLIRFIVAVASAGIFVFASPALADTAPARGYVRLSSDNPLQDKIAYLLTVLTADPDARAAMAAHPELAKIGRRLELALDEVHRRCSVAPTCTLLKARLSDQEIKVAADALAGIARQGNALSKPIKDHLRPSGYYEQYSHLSDPDFIRAAWSAVANGINGIYDIYLAGQPSQDIEQPILNGPLTEVFMGHANAVIDFCRDSSQPRTFFSIWAELGLSLLRINQRDDAVNWEPLDKRENARALVRGKTIDWTKYRYTAILSPSWGLNPGEVKLTAAYRYILRMAVQRWRDGLAPFIVLTGGQIHPDRTPYAPAIEGKRVLMSDFGVPEDAILVDPYARHSTTDLRNATRLLFQIGAPLEKAYLVTTIESAADHLAGNGTSIWVAPPGTDLRMVPFNERCRLELGYECFLASKRASPFDVEMLPNINSLTINLRDPLDP